MTRLPTLAVLLFLILAHSLVAQSPVDRKVELEKIPGEFQLADGPAWDGSYRLFVPDVRAQKLLQFAPKQNKPRVISVPPARFSASYFNLGRLFLSDNGNGRIAVLDENRLQPYFTFEEQEPAIRPNDLVVDNRGGMYVTLTRQGQVAYIGTDQKQRVAVKEIKTPNGIILSPDEKTLYVSAYVPKEIWAYPVTGPGVVGEGRKFAAMDDGPAKGADGMAIDRQGNVYCAGAADVWIWSPDGKLLDKIRTPKRPINCAFGDRDMRSLYITCFDGVYRQRMKAYGRPPHPPSLAKFQPKKNEKRPATTVPDTVQADLDVVYASYGTRKLLMDIFSPKAATQQARPAVVVVHGGGWLNGDKSKFRALAIALARRGYVTAAIEYRLGFEARFPAGIHDCNAAVRFLRGKALNWNVDPKRIGAVGGSAGGHLVGLMATASNVASLQGEGGHSKQSSRLQAAIVMAGPMQIASGSVAKKSRQMPEKSNANKWIGRTIDQAPDLYRLCDAHLHISKDDPPLLFMAGEHDFPARNQPSRDQLKKLGVPTGVKTYKDGKHGCWNQLPWFDDMVADMDGFFREHLKASR